MKNIYYFNITYSCNSNCIFCYSHNTNHSGTKYKEIKTDDFFNYLKQNKISSLDRVIINGGEPFLHNEIDVLLSGLSKWNCEVLIYTNGRLLDKHPLSYLNRNFRFIIPIHGDRDIHDRITRVKGSFDETISGIKYLLIRKCQVDIKLIINPLWVDNHLSTESLFHIIDSLGAIHAVHITKMADTIVSKKNNCRSVTNPEAAEYTKQLFDHFSKQYIVKIFDTCILNLSVPHGIPSAPEFKVFFKDDTQDWEINREIPEMNCRNNCPMAFACESAVGNYTVLEYCDYYIRSIE